MAISPVLEMTPDEEKDLVTRAQQGDRAAFGSLVGPWHQPLFRYVYRMVSLRQDAEDLLQDVLVRVLEGIRTYRGEARFKSWLFGIATHVCLDHLRSKKRWRVEAQLLAEAETIGDPAKSAALRSLMQQPGFSYEIREHIAFCFSCIARTLAPEEQERLIAGVRYRVHRFGQHGGGSSEQERDELRHRDAEIGGQSGEDRPHLA